VGPRTSLNSAEEKNLFLLLEIETQYLGHPACGPSTISMSYTGTPATLVINLFTSESTGLFISLSGISELDCATTKTDTAERSISIG